MRILVVSSFPPRHCGIGAYARDHVDWLRERGHQVAVLSPPDGDGDVRVPFHGGRPFLRAAHLGGGFDRVIVQFQPALYYRPRRPLSKIATSAALWWLAVRRSQLEVVVHEADPPTRWRPDFVLLRQAFLAAGRVSFHTQAERRSLEGRYRIRVRAAVVPHRVAPSGPPVPREEARDRLTVGRAGGPVFVCPGFLQPSKALERAVEAFRSAGVSAEGGRLYLVGSVRDPTPTNLAYAARLRSLAEATPGVTLVERFLPDAEFDLWVKAADWLILPYRRSWSSGVLARAHVLGTPSIVADTGGLDEQAGQGDVVVRDDAGLADAVREAAVARLGSETAAAANVAGQHDVEGRQTTRPSK